jgi:ankyrin repeat protein
MSGQDLRDAAIQGHATELKSLLLRRANPCSRDAMSLCALHYAVWNGHVECVKLLISNPFGVDSEGKRNSSLHFQSCLGYSGIFLVATSA